MTNNPMQPISNFCKTNQPYRIIDQLRFPGTTNAMHEIMTHCMRHQEFIVPISIIDYFSDVLEVSQRTVKTGLRQLEESGFILERDRKNCILNSFLANKHEILPGHLATTIVEPKPLHTKELAIITKVNKMRSYNQAINHPAYMHEIDQNALRFAKDAVYNQNIVELRAQLHKVESKLETMTLVMNELIKFIKQDDLPKAKSFLTVIEGGKKE